MGIEGFLYYGIYNNSNGKDNIKFLHVYSHTNKKDKHSIGNSKADELASKAIGRTPNYNKNYTSKN